MAARICPQAVLHLAAEVRLPTAEVIVHINDGNAGFLRALFQPQKLARHRLCVTEKLVRLRKIEVIDDVDQKQRDLRFIRSAAVQIRIFRRHGKERGGAQSLLRSTPSRLMLLLPAGFLATLLSAFSRRPFAALLPAT